MKTWYLPILLFFIFNSCQNNNPNGSYTLIKGGTLLDFGDLGSNSNDIEPAYILINGEKIEKFGKLTGKEDFPKSARVIDASGKYIIPGLIDGFAVLNNQEYANAFLYMGITSVIGVDGGRRGPFYHDANPSPDVYMLESIGDDSKSTSEHLADMQSLFESGYKVILLKYALKPDQVVAVKNKALELGLACIGELGHTSYEEGVENGVEVFVHTTRYSLDAVPKELAQAVANEPFSDDLESPKWKYYQYLYSMDMADEQLNSYAKVLGNSKSFLMPTLSLLYLDQPIHKNPWKYPVADILDEEDINSPADKMTGNHNYDPVIQENYTAMAKQVIQIEKKYRQNGAKYLAGSATDVWGTMPGISLHTELELLSRIGLSNREIIAAATTNFNKAFGWKTGKIGKDFTANILILDENPLDKLEALTRIQTILLKGKVIDRQKLIGK
ncbi:MAG: hypothetical protein QNK30_09875 [Bacteroidales bacterium]|nr:hypothetical protein [Bacteroidales bacterium]